jgi:superfamily II DNA or RNA helicase
VAYANGIAIDFSRRLGQGRAHVIDASTSKSERERILGEMTDGDGKVLVSVDVLREGFDLPIASCAIDLQTNKKLRTYWQKIGRIKRIYPGQRECVWIDMAGNYWRHPDPNCDPDWESLGAGHTTDDMPKKPGEPEPVRCPRCGHVFPEGGVRAGSTCPECGYEFDSRVKIRKIRQGSGKLVEVTVRDKQEKSAERRREDAWIGELFRGWCANMSFNQCAASYYRRHGEWPSSSWFKVPPTTFDGYTKVRAEFARKGDLYRRYLEGKEHVAS